MLINVVVQESERKTIKPIQTFVSQQSAISLGTPINFTHGLANFNSLTQTCLLTGFLVCTTAQYGYVPGDIVTPERGISYQLTTTQIICRPASNGVYIVRANNGRWAKINPNRWNIMIKALVL